MLSFFSKKKQSVDTPPEEAIQGPADPAQTNDSGGGTDDFIFVERKPMGNDPAKMIPQGMGIYPPMPPAFGVRFPEQPAYPPSRSNTMDNAMPVPYVQGVPFELAPQLSSKRHFEVTQLQVDSILALLTRQMSVDENEEYNFALERSIQNELLASE